MQGRADDRMARHGGKEIIADGTEFILIADKFGVGRQQGAQRRGAVIVSIEIDAAFLEKHGQSKNVGTHRHMLGGLIGPTHVRLTDCREKLARPHVVQRR